MGSSNLNSEELRTICPQDCGNAPKKLVLKEFTIALVKNDLAKVSELVSDTVCWNIVGAEKVLGRDHFAEALKKMSRKGIIELQISTIITHGVTGAVNGAILLDDQERVAFCHVILFTSAGKTSKIKELTSYIMKE